MTIQGNRPLIGVISDRRMQGEHPFHMVGEKYLQAIADGSDAYPVALPLLALMCWISSTGWMVFS
jgi:hypothetical protein